METRILGQRLAAYLSAALLGPILLVSVAVAVAQRPPENDAAVSSKPPGLRLLQGDDAQQAADLDQAVAVALNAGCWDEAIAREEEVVALRARVQGPDHFETVDDEWSLMALRRVAPMPPKDRLAYRSAETMNDQAVALYAQGKHAAAQPLFEKALAIRRRLLTDHHPKTTESYNNLAANLYAQGKYAAAQPPYEKALAIRRRLLTDHHPRTATSYNSLAANLNDQGQYAAAQPLFEKALAIRRRLLTDDHPDTAESFNGLAYNLDDQGKHALAQPLYEKALAIRQRLLSDNHPDTVQSYSNLAANLYAQGKYALAQPLYEKDLDICRQLLTDDHPQTATTYNNLAANLDAQGKHALAQPLLEKVLAIRQRLLSDDHPDTATTYNNLAVNLDAQGKHALAQPLLEKALAIRQRLLGDDHPDTARSYNNLAMNLDDQGKYTQAQPLLEKALAIRQRLLSDDHPQTAGSYNNLAGNLSGQGQYARAQPLFEKALAIRRRLLTDDHPNTTSSYNNLANNLHAQGKYFEARDRWLSAVKGLDQVRLLVAFTGLERAEAVKSPRPALAAVQARLGRPLAAWRALEEDLGRGLLDELAAREDGRLAPAQRDHLRELTTALERLDKLVEATPKDLAQAERAKRFEDLRRQRERASIALGEFQARLVQEHGARAGPVAGLSAVQAALPADAALVAWVDLNPPGPNAADPDGEHWGVVVRARGGPAWVPIAGTGPGGHWTKDDTSLPDRVRTELRRRPEDGAANLRPLFERLRTQRLERLARALGATTDGLPPARRLIVLPSRTLAGIPVEALLEDGDARTVSYAPSATVFKDLRERPRPDRHAGLLALGDPVYRRPDASSDPQPPDHGLLVHAVAPGSAAAARGLEAGDVLLSYNGAALHRREDLKTVPEPARPVPVDRWRDGRVDRLELAPGPLGVVLDPRPAPLAIADQRQFRQVLAAVRSGGDDFDPLPGTRAEVEALALLFRSDGRAARILLGADASEPELDRLADAGALAGFGVIHLATHAVIDAVTPARSAAILTQVGCPTRFSRPWPTGRSSTGG
jgi:tetratricopeptide (TPR) repeat protein